MRRSSNATYNLISLLFLVLTVFSFLCVLGMLTRSIAPPAFLRGVAAVPPTPVAPPTDTATPRPSQTPTPTETPTPSDTPTPLPPTATETLTPSITPTDTQTPLPSKTPTNPPPPTKTPLPSKTPKGFVASKVAGPAISPTSSFPFMIAGGSPSAGPNPDTATGCKFQGIAGQILDINSAPLLTNVQVFIAGPNGYKKLVKPDPANNQLFSPESYLLQVDNKTTLSVYTVEVLDLKGTQISEKATVTFTNDCQKNAIYVNFIQTRPY